MKNFLVGITIGTGAILPGISSGVLCVVFGLYEKIINSITNFFKDIKQNFKFLFPLAIGVLVGVFVCGNILNFLFDKFSRPISFVFIGLILGSIKIVFNQIKTHKIKFSYILCALFTSSLSFYLITLEKTSLVNQIIDTQNNSFLIICGILMSAGIVIPGVSKTVILMILGIYQTYLDAIVTLNLNILLPIIIGLIIGGIIFLILLKFLFEHFKIHTYFGIIGFTISSVLILYPGFSLNLEGIISLILCVLAFGVSCKI